MNIMNKKYIIWGLSVACILNLLTGCVPTITTTTPFVEPEIPENYTTYTDEQGLFSISYPNDWEPFLSLLEDAFQSVKDVIESINEDIPIENVTYLFISGIMDKSGSSILPNVNIVVEPLPSEIRNLNQMVEASTRTIKEVISDYHEISRTKTTINGMEAVIIEWEGTYPEFGQAHPFQMYELVGRNAWCVTCTASPSEFDVWKSDFQSIVRSLRIHTLS
jgi:hypothetical protein